MPAPTPPPPLDVPAQGWVEDPVAVAEVVDRLTFKTFGDTPAASSSSSRPRRPNVS